MRLVKVHREGSCLARNRKLSRVCRTAKLNKAATSLLCWTVCRLTLPLTMLVPHQRGRYRNWTWKVMVKAKGMEVKRHPMQERHVKVQRIGIWKS